MGFLKTVFKFGCGFFLLMAALFAGLMWYGQSSGEAVAKDFFAHVASEPPASFDKYVHPALQDKAEPEMISMFFRELLSQHGSFQGLSMNGMSFSDNTTNGERTQEFKGTFRFEKKEIPLELKFQNGLLIAFEVQDKQIGRAILEASTKIPAGCETKFAKRTELFWRAATAGDPAIAFEMLNEALKEQFGRDKFVQTFGDITAKLGKMENIRFVSSRPKEPNSSKALFFFSLDFANEKSVSVHSTVEFAMFQGHQVGFQIPTDEKP